MIWHMAFIHAWSEKRWWRYIVFVNCVDKKMSTVDLKTLQSYIPIVIRSSSDTLVGNSAFFCHLHMVQLRFSPLSASCRLKPWWNTTRFLVQNNIHPHKLLKSEPLSFSGQFYLSALAFFGPKFSSIVLNLFYRYTFAFWPLATPASDEIKFFNLRNSSCSVAVLPQCINVMHLHNCDAFWPPTVCSSPEPAQCVCARLLAIIRRTSDRDIIRRWHNGSTVRTCVELINHRSEAPWKCIM